MKDEGALARPTGGKPSPGFFASFAWALSLAACVAVTSFATTEGLTDEAADSYRLAAGASAWEPLHEPAELAGSIDAAELADGRIGACSASTPDASRARPCVVWDPRKGAWTHEVAIVPSYVYGYSAARDGSLVVRASSWSGEAETTLSLSLAGSACSVRENGGRELPALPMTAPPSGACAVRLPSGTLLLVVTDSLQRAAGFALRPGESTWATLPLPATGVFELRPGPGETAIASGSALSVYSGGAWRALPPLPDARTYPAIVQARDGSIYAFGGLVQQLRRVVYPVRRALVLAATIGLVALPLLALRRLVRSSQLSFVRIASGVFVGGCLVPGVVAAVVGFLGWFFLRLGAHF